MQLTKTEIESLQNRIDAAQELAKKDPETFHEQTFNNMERWHQYLMELLPEQFSTDDALDWSAILGDARMVSYLKNLLDDGLRDGDFPEKITTPIWSEQSIREHEAKLNEDELGIYKSLFDFPDLETMEDIVELVENGNFQILCYSRAKQLIAEGEVKYYTEQNPRQTVPLPSGRWEIQTCLDDDAVDVAFSDALVNIDDLSTLKKLLICVLSRPYDFVMGLREVIQELEKEKATQADVVSMLGTDELSALIAADKDVLREELKSRRKAA